MEKLGPGDESKEEQPNKSTQPVEGESGYIYENEVKPTGGSHFGSETEDKLVTN